MLEFPSGHTGIRLQDTYLESLLANPHSHVLSPTFTPSDFPAKAGVYCVTNVETSEQYVGSAINYRARWETHYNDITGSRPSPLHREFSRHGLDKFLWTPLETYTNYLYDFTLNHNTSRLLDYDSYRALQVLTQYNCRVLEQSITHAIEPALCGNQQVIFSFNWPSNYDSISVRGERPITAIEKTTGTVIEFNSLRAASKSLDIDQRSIKGILNHEGYCRGSRSTGQLFSFIEKSLPMKEGSPHKNLHNPLVETFDYS